MNITGTPVIGKARALHRRENKQRRQALQATQPLDVSYWTCHKGDYNIGQRTVCLVEGQFREGALVKSIVEWKIYKERIGNSTVGK